MPGFDGMGPMGMGPMTGGRRGFCAIPYEGYGPYGYGFQAPYYPPTGMYPFYSQPFYGPVFGAGRGGILWGGGMGRGMGMMSPTPPPPQAMSKEQEIQMLKEQTQVLEDQLKMIGQRIEELSKKGN
jgi:hypothetical protein